MGNLFPKQVSDLEKLDRLTESIQRMEDFHSTLRVKKELWTDGLVTYGTGLYFLAGGLLYLSRSWEIVGGSGKTQILCCALYPVLLILLRGLVAWAFNVRLDNAAFRLTCLRGERKEIMEAISRAEPRKALPGIRAQGPPQRGPAPRKGLLDRLMEAVVGDGCSNRFALICSRCCSHNGMALREEYEYISFLCHSCRSFNPARKIRPASPRLATRASLPSDAGEEKAAGDELGGRTAEESEPARRWDVAARYLDSRPSRQKGF